MSSFHKDKADIFFQAARSNDLPLLEQMLSSEEKYLNARDLLGKTALHICASYGYFAAARLLLGHEKCAVDLQDYESGYTALHRALYYGHYDVALLLLKHGAKLIHDSFADYSGDGKTCASWRQSIWGRSLSNIDAWDVPIDHEGYSPLDLLTLKLAENRASKEVHGNEIVAFGKADFFLGTMLPNASPAVNKPRPVSDISNVSIKLVSCSKYHSAAVSNNGTLFTWGLGNSGKLGHGNVASYPFPKACTALSSKVIKWVSCSENHSLAVTKAGVLYSWGGNRFGQLGHGSSSLGDGRSDYCLSPKRVMKLKDSFVLKAAAGLTHSVCYTLDNDIWSWGSNKHGQLGSRTTSTTGGKLGAPGSATPAVVTWPQSCGSCTKPNVIDLCVSNTCTLLLRKPYNSEDILPHLNINEVYQWGNGFYTPTKVLFQPKSRKHESDEFRTSSFVHKQVESIVSIAVGNNHCVGLSCSGNVYSWGLGAAQLGHGSGDRHHLSFPKLVESLVADGDGGKVVHVSAAGDRSSAVTEKGDVFTWGSCDCTGALGHGKHTYQPVPRCVFGIKGAVQIATAPDHTLVLISTGIPPLPHESIERGVCSMDDDDISPRPLVGDISNAHLPSGDDPSIPSLRDLCENKIAENVNLRNVLGVLSVAETYSCIALFNFCLSFIRMNFDILLMQLLSSGSLSVSKKSDEIDFLMYCFSDPFNQVSMPQAVVAPPQCPYPTKTDVAEAIATTDTHCVDGTEVGRNERPSDLVAVIKQIKAVRKKLSAVAALESSPCRVFSEEEAAKVKKKGFFEAKLSELEQLKVELGHMEDADDKPLRKVKTPTKRAGRKDADRPTATATATVTTELTTKRKKAKTKFLPLEAVLKSPETKQTDAPAHSPQSELSPWKVTYQATETFADDIKCCISIESVEGPEKKGRGANTPKPKKAFGKKVSLGEFLSPPPKPKLMPTGEDLKDCPWATTAPPGQCTAASNLVQIQEEEEQLRKESTVKVLTGNSSPWLIDRRSAMSNSLVDVMKSEELEREIQLEIMASEKQKVADKREKMKKKSDSKRAKLSNRMGKQEKAKRGKNC